MIILSDSISALICGVTARGYSALQAGNIYPHHIAKFVSITFARRSVMVKREWKRSGIWAEWKE
jgi:hypothetical protein